MVAPMPGIFMPKNVTATQSNKPASSSFAGFHSPTTTPIPDQLFDELMPTLNGAELKVLLYICRRTFGFKKQGDAISLSQLVSGITTREGRVLDGGTGLGKSSVARALNSLETKNIIVRQRRASQGKGDEPTWYALNVLVTPVSQNGTPPGDKMAHPLSPQRDTQQTEEQQTEKQQLLGRLQKAGIPLSTAEKLCQTYPSSHIQQKLDYLDFLQAKRPGKVRRPRGWLMKAISENYEAPEGYISPAEREAARASQAQKEALLQKTARRQEQIRQDAHRHRQQQQHEILRQAMERYQTTRAEAVLWQDIQQQLGRDTPPTTQGLLAQTHLLSTADGSALIGTSSQFVAEHLQKKFGDQLAALFRERGWEIDAVAFVDLGSLAEPAAVL